MRKCKLRSQQKNQQQRNKQAEGNIWEFLGFCFQKCGNSSDGQMTTTNILRQILNPATVKP